MDTRASNDPRCAPFLPLLAGYVDGELAPADQQRVAAHLQQCPRCADDLAHQRAVQAALRRIGATLQPSAALRERIQRQEAYGVSRSGARRWLLLAGGLAAVLAVLTVFGWLRWASHTPSRAVLSRVVIAHQQETLGEAPVSFVSSDPRAVAAWAESQTHLRVEMPAFEATDYQLLGARLEPTVATDAVTLVYAGARGRLTCTLLPAEVPMPFQLALPEVAPPTDALRIAGQSVTSWGDRDTSYVLVGDLEPRALLQLARLVIKPD